MDCTQYYCSTLTYACSQAPSDATIFFSAGNYGNDAFNTDVKKSLTIAGEGTDNVTVTITTGGMSISNLGDIDKSIYVISFTFIISNESFLIINSLSSVFIIQTVFTQQEGCLLTGSLFSASSGKLVLSSVVCKNIKTGPSLLDISTRTDRFIITNKSVFANITQRKTNTQTCPGGAIICTTLNTSGQFILTNAEFSNVSTDESLDGGVLYLVINGEPANDSFGFKNLSFSNPGTARYGTYVFIHSLLNSSWYQNSQLWEGLTSGDRKVDNEFVLVDGTVTPPLKYQIYNLILTKSDMKTLIIIVVVVVVVVIVLLIVLIIILYCCCGINIFTLILDLFCTTNKVEPAKENNHQNTQKNFQPEKSNSTSIPPGTTQNHSSPTAMMQTVFRMKHTSTTVS